MTAAAAGATVPNTCVALAHPTSHVQSPRAGSTPRLHTVVGAQFALTEKRDARRSPLVISPSPVALKVGKTERMITRGGEEIHSCEHPSPRLWVKVSKQRGLAIPDHPCRSTRKEKGLAAILALIFADTLRREVVRDYTSAHRHPMPMCAPVYWADTGEVYASLPLWQFGDKEEERYELLLPKASRIVWQYGPHVRQDLSNS